MRIRGTFSSVVGLAACGLVGVLATALPAGAQGCPGNPDAIGTSRLIAIAPQDYPRVGKVQYPQTLPLADHEVVITFDDGPLPPYSTQILDILAAQCVKATYFIIGSMARAYPAVVRREREEGHTLGTHSENHPLRFDRLPLDRLQREIDDGIADVGAAVGDPGALAPFFRIPGLGRSDLVEQELAARSLSVFSADAVADDWHRHISPAKIVALAISRLEARGRGILLLHDIHPWTVAALPSLFKELKDHGFHIVQVVPAGPDQPETIATQVATEAIATQAIASQAMELTVAWSAAAQDVMDDSGAAPGWPSFEVGSLAGPIALPAPDPASFVVAAALSRPASPTDAETASVSAEIGGAETSWPDESELDVSATVPQLAVPSVADIGWPVNGRNIADREPSQAPSHEPSARPSVDHAAAIGHGRLRYIRSSIRSNVRAHVRPIARHLAPSPAHNRQHATLPSTLAGLLTPASDPLR